LAYKYYEEEPQQDYTYLPDPLKYTSVSLQEVRENKLRLEASAFNLEAKVAKDKILANRYGYAYAWAKNGLIKECFYGGRAKRNYVSKDTDGAVGFIGSAEMLNIYPKPIKFLSSNIINIEQFKVKEGTVLISRSGTIGNVTFVNKTLAKNLISEHAIRIIAKDNPGYLYAYFATEIGKTIVQSNTFGAVVDQIEPEHFEKIVIPNAPELLKKEIHELVIASYDLRDQSNDLLDHAEKILYEELQLKPIEELAVKYFDSSVDLRNYTTKLENLNLRLDCSYHLPVFNTILNHISQYSSEIQYLKNPQVTKSIILPGRFKRTYVESEEYGIKFIGGKQINDLNPNSEKYLSKSIHNTRLGKELLLNENCILITRSGTIGKVSIVPKHWENWAANEHIIRVFPKNNDIAGYLFCWLNSDYGKELICKHTYGAVVDEIDTNHVGDIPLPLLRNQSKQQEINDLVLQANALRYQAHLKEQEAIKKMEAIIEGEWIVKRINSMS
jgi:type I restriction enzyme S subunit